jgi:uncharacterized protein YlxW (UPF0749 family)
MNLKITGNKTKEGDEGGEILDTSKIKLTLFQVFMSFLATLVTATTTGTFLQVSQNHDDIIRLQEKVVSLQLSVVNLNNEVNQLRTKLQGGK